MYCIAGVGLRAHVGDRSAWAHRSAVSNSITLLQHATVRSYRHSP